MWKLGLGWDVPTVRSRRDAQRALPDTRSRSCPCPCPTRRYKPAHLERSLQVDPDTLDVYRLATDLVALADTIVEQLPRGSAYLADPLQGAATSIPLNIAEGSASSRPARTLPFYRMARRSATERSATLDVGRRLGILASPRYDAGRKWLVRTVSILIAMARRSS